MALLSNAATAQPCTMMDRLSRCHVNKASAKQVQLVNHGHTWGKGLLEKGCTHGQAKSKTSHT
jgi:hypothetical protein